MSMRLAIIALLISLAALGLAGFATARTFNDSHPAAPVAESQWSEEECAANRAAAGLPGSGYDDLRSTLLWRCINGGCDAYNDMLQAIAENCP